MVVQSGGVIEVEFAGTLTGRVFRYDKMRPLDAPANPGATMFGHYKGVDLERGEPVYVRAVDELSSGYADSVRRVRHAITVAGMPAVADCAAIVQLIDYEDRRLDLYGWGDDYAVVKAAWEWGEPVLLDELSRGDYAPRELSADVEAGLAAALACLHAAGLVHSDVAPNNVVRVAGVWKLADLDNVVREGQPITGLPREPSRYRMPGVEIGDLARPEIDHHGLGAILERITSG
jgi:hypothetical protein